MRRGYSLVEVLSALAISIGMAGVVLSAWSSLFNQGSRHSAIGITRSSFTQKDAKAGVRRQTVADIEQGRTWPDVATIARILAPMGAKATAAKAS